MSEGFWKGFFAVPRICTQSPFWFLNDVVDGDVYARQVEAMAEKGVMQVMPHPRYGMDRREYLGPRYMDAFAQMVERADALGMAVNLYDDFNWSSGQCGGRITADRRLCALGLAMVSAPVDRPGQTVVFDDWTSGFYGWAQFEQILLAGWAPPLAEDSLDFDCMTLTDEWTLEAGRLSFVVPEGGQTAFFIYTVRTIHESPLREGNGGIIDYLGKAPARAFLQSTHEAYYARLGRYFGGTIQSIFSDEVGPYACGDFTWSDDFRDYFQAHKGYDIVPLLPILYFDGSPRAPKVRCDYWDAVTSAYQDHFMRPIADWCEAHGIASTGHTFEESRLWMISGNMYESLRTQHWVGVDSLLGYKPYSMIKPAISVAHATGRRTVVCEAVGVLGEGIGEHGSWTCSPRQLKYAYNQLAVAGVTLMVPHAFFQSVDNPKVECPPSFFEDNPYWRYYQDIARLTDILCYVNRQTEHVADVAVFYPIESWWSLSRGGRGRGTPTASPNAEKSRWLPQSEAFDSIIDGLMRRQLDQDVLDLRALEEAELSGGYIRLHGEAYSALALPPMTCVRTAVLERLLAVADAGVTLVSLGAFHPEASVENGLGDERFLSLAQALARRITVVENLDEMARVIRQRADCDITLLAGNRDALDTAHRRTEGLDIYLLSNLRDGESDFTLRLRASARRGQLLDSLARPLPSELELHADHTIARVTLPAEELCYLILSQNPLPKAICSPLTRSGLRRTPILRDIPGWRCAPAPGFSGAFPYGVLPMQTLPVPLGRTTELREASGDVAFLSRWMIPGFDDTGWQQVALKRAPALYDHKNSQYFRFVIPAGACALRMPFPSECEYALYINGRHVVSMLDFQETEPCWLPVDGCKDAPGLLAVEAASMRPGFGLTGAPQFLLAPFETALRPWSGMGIEWYSGFVVYEKTFWSDSVATDMLWLDLGDVRECCEVWINGMPAGRSVWPPYQFEISRLIQPGENRLRVAVCNLMANEYTWDVIGSRGTGRYLPSGLLGPVRLGKLELI